MEDEELLELLDDGDLFEVVDYSEHPEFAWQLHIAEEVADEHKDDLRQLVDDLTEVPGVSEAIQEDREVILVAGDVAGPFLEQWLTRWWRGRIE